MISNPVSQNTTAAPRINDTSEISAFTATQAPTGAQASANPRYTCDQCVKRLVIE